MKTEMFEELCKESTLLQAWKVIKTKGCAGGIDGKSIAEIENDIGFHIESLQKELISGNWIPQPSELQICVFFRKSSFCLTHVFWLRSYFGS